MKSVLAIGVGSKPVIITFDNVYLSDDIYNRIMEHSIILSSGCIKCTYKPQPDGYTRISITLGGYNKKNIYTHRIVLARKLGRWPNPDALHTCDFRACINEDHLYEGNDLDNSIDKVSRGRTNPPKMFGETNPSAKLTNRGVNLLRKLWGTGRYTKKALSIRFDITSTQVSNIVNDRSRTNG